MASDDVVLTVPAQAEFGDVARRAAGELARRQGFDNRQWADLETAVGQTLRLLRGAGASGSASGSLAGGSDIVVEAELTGSGAATAQRLCRSAIDDFRASREPLVDGTEVDGGRRARPLRVPKHPTLAVPGRASSPRRTQPRPLWPQPPSPRSEGGQLVDGHELRRGERHDHAAGRCARPGARRRRPRGRC